MVTPGYPKDGETDGMPARLGRLLRFPPTTGCSDQWVVQASQLPGVNYDVPSDTVEIANVMQIHLQCNLSPGTWFIKRPRGKHSVALKLCSAWHVSYSM